MVLRTHSTTWVAIFRGRTRWVQTSVTLNNKRPSIVDIDHHHFRFGTRCARPFHSSLIRTTMATLKPPQPPPSWNHSPESVLVLTKEAIEKERKRQDQIGALAPEDCTFKSVSP